MDEPRRDAPLADPGGPGAIPNDTPASAPDPDATDPPQLPHRPADDRGAGSGGEPYRAE
jgi:hypothetical protein